MVGYTVQNSVLRRRMSGAVKRDFRTYIRRYTSPKENFEYGYPQSNALLQFHLKLQSCKLHYAALHPTNCDIINDVKLFPTIYRRIFCHKFLTITNQTSRYKSKCIRMYVVGTQKLHLIDMILLSIHNMCFGKNKTLGTLVVPKIPTFQIKIKNYIMPVNSIFFSDML